MTGKISDELIVASGGVGRRVPVPDRLVYPALTFDPAFNGLDRRIRESLNRMPPVSYGALKKLAAFADDDRLRKRDVTAFADELLPFLPPRIGLPDYKQAITRSLHEAAASAALVRTLSPSIASQSTLDLIISIRAALGLPRALRTGRVSTVPDRFNNVVDYPSIDSVPSLIDDIEAFRKRYGALFPYCTAAVIFVGIVHAHPFTDGNGRTARTAFNVLTSIATGTIMSLPLAVISLLTDGGFVIKLRRAMHGGEWSGLFYFLAAAGCLFAEIETTS